MIFFWRERDFCEKFLSDIRLSLPDIHRSALNASKYRKSWRLDVQIVPLPLQFTASILVIFIRARIYGETFLGAIRVTKRPMAA